MEYKLNATVVINGNLESDEEFTHTVLEIEQIVNGQSRPITIRGQRVIPRLHIHSLEPK